MYYVKERLGLLLNHPNIACVTFETVNEMQSNTIL